MLSVGMQSMAPLVSRPHQSKSRYSRPKRFYKTNHSKIQLEKRKRKKGRKPSGWSQSLLSIHHHHLIIFFITTTSTCCCQSTTPAPASPASTAIVSRHGYSRGEDGRQVRGGAFPGGGGGSRAASSGCRGAQGGAGQPLRFLHHDEPAQRPEHQGDGGADRQGPVLQRDGGAAAADGGALAGVPGLLGSGGLGSPVAAGAGGGAGPAEVRVHDAAADAEPAVRGHGGAPGERAHAGPRHVLRARRPHRPRPQGAAPGPRRSHEGRPLPQAHPRRDRDRRPRRHDEVLERPGGAAEVRPRDGRWWPVRCPRRRRSRGRSRRRGRRRGRGVRGGVGDPPRGERGRRGGPEEGAGGRRGQGRGGLGGPSRPALRLRLRRAGVRAGAPGGRRGGQRRRQEQEHRAALRRRVRPRGLRRAPPRPRRLRDAAEPGREDGDRRGEAQQPGGGAQAAREARIRVDVCYAATITDHGSIQLAS